jgi:hypothetical protein
MAGELMAQRRPRVASEMLLPLSRTQLVNGLFAAAVHNSVVLWLIMNGTLGLLVGTTSDRYSLRAVAIFLMLAASTMFASMAICLRTSIWTSTFKRFGILWITWMSLMVPINLWWTYRVNIGDAPFLLLPVLLLAVGALFYRSARHAWMNLELG